MIVRRYRNVLITIIVIINIMIIGYLFNRVIRFISNVNLLQFHKNIPLNFCLIDLVVSLALSSFSLRCRTCSEKSKGKGRRYVLI